VEVSREPHRGRDENQPTQLQGLFHSFPFILSLIAQINKQIKQEATSSIEIMTNVVQNVVPPQLSSLLQNCIPFPFVRPEASTTHNYPPPPPPSDIITPPPPPSSDSSQSTPVVTATAQEDPQIIQIPIESPPQAASGNTASPSV